MKTKLWHQHIDSLYAVACEESKERKKDFFLRQDHHLWSNIECFMQTKKNLSNI